jgi:hypothetical protein
MYGDFLEHLSTKSLIEFSTNSLPINGLFISYRELPPFLLLFPSHTPLYNWVGCLSDSLNIRYKIHIYSKLSPSL